MSDGLLQSLVDNPWWWFGLAVVLGIGEIITPGVFLVWIAMAAALTGGVAMLFAPSPPLQFMIFALFCLGCVLGGRRWYVDNPVASEDPLLNDRTARLIGEVVMVVEPIDHGHGRVRVGDGVWDCSGPDAAPGATMRITGARGTTLLVEPV